MLLDPATGSNFFGRREILELLKKRVDGLRCGYRQNVAIIGPRYYGKTSVIYRFIETIPFNDVVPVYIEIKPQGISNFAGKFISNLIFKYLTNTEYKITEVKDLVSLAADIMPKTVKAIRSIEALIKNGKTSKAYSVLFELPGIAYAETGRRAVVILDEFHRITDFGIDNAFATLGKYIMVQKDIMYIVTSSQINEAKDILSEKLSLLFGNFEICELGTFEVSTANEFINSRLRANTIPKHIGNFLIAFTGGQPFYLDSILLNLDDNLSATSRDNQMEAITRTFAEVLFDSKGILNQHFANLVSELEKQDQRYISILLAVSNGNKKMQTIAVSSHLKVRDLKPLLDKLIDYGWVAKYGVIHCMKDKVFEFWLRNVYQNKEYLLEVNYEPKISKFNAEIKDEINGFFESNKRDYLQLIPDLFTSFNNELIEIGKRNFKFPPFKTFEVVNTKNCDISYITLSNDECSWSFLISLSPLNEGNISDFLEYCHQVKEGIKRKVIISLAEMDVNTKLLVKESRSWIWSLNELNELFDIAGKQRIILYSSDKAGSPQSESEQSDDMETA